MRFHKHRHHNPNEQRSISILVGLTLVKLSQKDLPDIYSAASRISVSLPPVVNSMTRSDSEWSILFLNKVPASFPRMLPCFPFHPTRFSHVFMMTENHDEKFSLLGYYEPERLRPIFVFLHVLRNRDFQLGLIPALYDTLIHTGLIVDQSTICLVVTVGLCKRVTVIHHAQAEAMQFTRNEVYRLLCEGLTLKRRSQEMLIVGYSHSGGEYFYTKFEAAPDNSDVKIIPNEGFDEIGQIYYAFTTKTIT